MHTTPRPLNSMCFSRQIEWEAESSVTGPLMGSASHDVDCQPYMSVHAWASWQFSAAPSIGAWFWCHTHGPGVVGREFRV